MHVWAWRQNHVGSFADWNTRVTCDKQPNEKLTSIVVTGAAPVSQSAMRVMLALRLRDEILPLPENLGAACLGPNTEHLVAKLGRWGISATYRLFFPLPILILLIGTGQSTSPHLGDVNHRFLIWVCSVNRVNRLLQHGRIMWQG
jgi:hypothetical protein